MISTFRSSEAFTLKYLKNEGSVNIAILLYYTLNRDFNFNLKTIEQMIYFQYFVYHVHSIHVRTFKFPTNAWSSAI